MDPRFCGMATPANVSCRPQCPGGADTSAPGPSTTYFVVESVAGLLAIAGNAFICAAILRDRKLRAVVTYHFLASLAAADALVGAVAIPCAQLSAAGLPQGQPRLCLLMLCTLLGLTQASVFGLLGVAVERYVAILQPLQYPAVLSPRNARWGIAASWSLAMALGLLPLLGWHKPLLPDGRCLFNAIIEDTYMVYFNFLACMLLPLVVMLGLYARIFLAARRHIRQVAVRGVPGGGRGRVLRRELHVAASLFLVLCCFALCWLPLHVLNTMTLFCPSCPLPGHLVLAAIALSHANSALNPVLYVLRLRAFRQAFEAALACSWAPPGRALSMGLVPSSGQGLGSRNDLLPGK